MMCYLYSKKKQLAKMTTGIISATFEHIGCEITPLLTIRSGIIGVIGWELYASYLDQKFSKKIIAPSTIIGTISQYTTSFFSNIGIILYDTVTKLGKSIYNLVSSPLYLFFGNNETTTQFDPNDNSRNSYITMTTTNNSNYTYLKICSSSRLTIMYYFLIFTVGILNYSYILIPIYF